jgi:hypothetical protein
MTRVPIIQNPLRRAFDIAPTPKDTLFTLYIGQELLEQERILLHAGTIGAFVKILTASRRPYFA